MPETRRFGNCVVTFDDRYPPVMITIWSGRSGMDAARWYIEVTTAANQRLLDAGLPIVTISNALDAERPSPEVRKYWADSISGSSAEVHAASIGTYVVFGSALMRGVMTAIGWLSEEARKVTTVGTMYEAVEGALAKLDAAGVARPEGLSANGYEPPNLPRVAESG